MHSVAYAICMLGIHVLSSQASVDFQHTLTGVSLVRRAALPSTVHGYDLRPPEHYCAADATACTWYLHTCQDVCRSPPVLTASGPVYYRRITSYVGPNRSLVDNDTIRAVRHLSYVKRSCAHDEHSTPQRPRVRPPQPPGHNTCCAISVHNALARTHSWRTPPAVFPKGTTLALSNVLHTNLVAGCRILQSCAGLSRCDSKPCLNLHSCQHTCQADWRVPPASLTTGLMPALQEDRNNAGRYSLLNRSGVCGPAGHSISSMCYLSRGSNKYICQADRRAPPAAHQPSARPTLRFLLIVCEMYLPETTWQAWRQQEMEDQLPINRCCLLESELPDGDLWNRPNLSISHRGKLLSRAIIGSLEQLSTPSVRQPHSRHTQGLGLSTSPSRSNGSAQWLSLTLPMHTMLDWLCKLPENMLRRCMCLPSGVSFDYWTTNVFRDDSGVRWNERWPYTPDPYRIMDCPQRMLWIGLTVSVDKAFAPQQSDDSSDSSAGVPACRHYGAPNSAWTLTCVSIARTQLLIILTQLD